MIDKQATYFSELLNGTTEREILEENDTGWPAVAKC